MFINKKTLLCYCISIFLIFNVNAQIAINKDNSPPEPTAMLDIKSNDKGMLVPRMTSIERLAINSPDSPARGLLVYDNTTNSFWYYSGLAWKEIAAEMTHLTIIRDDDNDTKIQVEKTPDDDVIRFDLAGSERLRLSQSPTGATLFELPDNHFNVFIGMNAGQSTTQSNTTDGRYNSFIGYQSGFSNTTGYRNVFNGHLSGYSNDIGGNNVFIGYESGYSNTSGISNNFIGYRTGYSNIEGGSNIFIGYLSGFSNTTGDSNNFMGYRSGYTNDSGNFNVFNGNDAGYFNVSGNNNIFIGYQSGFANNTGNNNTSIGYQSGFSNNNGNDNVFVGYQAGYFETGNDKLYIANTSTATPLIWGDFMNGNVGIARVANTNSLEVEGDASKTVPGNWLGNSDARLKKNINSLNAEWMLDKLLSLQGVSYEWNDTSTDYIRPEGIQYGFIAQNIQEVFPSLVKEDELGYLMTAYGTYDAMTIEAIRALNDKVTALEEENKILQKQVNKIKELETMMTDLQMQINASKGTVSNER